MVWKRDIGWFDLVGRMSRVAMDWEWSIRMLSGGRVVDGVFVSVVICITGLRRKRASVVMAEARRRKRRERNLRVGDLGERARMVVR